MCLKLASYINNGFDLILAQRSWRSPPTTPFREALGIWTYTQRGKSLPFKTLTLWASLLSLALVDCSLATTLVPYLLLSISFFFSSYSTFIPFQVLYLEPFSISKMIFRRSGTVIFSRYNTHTFLLILNFSHMLSPNFSHFTFQS